MPSLAKQKPQPAPLLNPTIFPWLCGSLCLAVAPHMLRFPVWLSLFIGMLLSYKLIALKKNPPFRKTITGILTALSLGMILLTYGKILGCDAGVTLLSIMLFLKLLETSTYRDGMILILFTYFLVITNFLYSQTILMGGYLLLTVVMTTLTLISLNQKHAMQPQKKISLSLHLLLLSIPAVVMLFILFPRIPGPLWGLPADAYGGKTGLSEQMTPGSISELALSDEIAFRAKFSGPLPSAHTLYWRASVLWHFDGRTWRNITPLFTRENDTPETRTPIDYTITLEPHNRAWLFLLDIPAANKHISNTLPLNQDYVLRARHPISTLKQYTARSFLNYRIDKTLPSGLRDAGLQLPPRANPEAIHLAASWKTARKTPTEIINTTLQMFREDFTYTLKPPLLGQHPIDEFLFKTRKGFCEHYASSFVFLMRAAGIPARVVMGYQGGEINPIDEYLIVRQADAHAWAEVWVENAGWIRIDPTAAVSPERIETGLDTAITPEENPRLTLAKNIPLLAELRTLLDATNNRWNQWVLGYGPEIQQKLLSQLGLPTQYLEHLLLITVLAISLLFLAATLFVLRTTRKPGLNEVTALYTRFCKKLAEQGIVRMAHEGPIDFSERACTNLPGYKQEIQAITRLYVALRYKTDHPQKIDIQHLYHLRHLVMRFRVRARNRKT